VVTEEDHVAGEAACKRRMGIARGGWSCLGGRYQRGGYRGPSIVRVGSRLATTSMEGSACSWVEVSARLPWRDLRAVGRWVA
jgi:hypothetical protein